MIENQCNEYWSYEKVEESTFNILNLTTFTSHILYLEIKIYKIANFDMLSCELKSKFDLLLILHRIFMVVCLLAGKPIRWFAAKNSKVTMDW